MNYMNKYKKIRINRTKVIDEHRYIWEVNYGDIPAGYVIHHKDGNKNNNSIDNLECIPLSEHSRIHMLGNKRSEESIEKERLTKERNKLLKYKDIPEGYWVCNTCGELLLLSYFYTDKSSWHGHSNECRECRSRKRSPNKYNK